MRSPVLLLAVLVAALVGMVALVLRPDGSPTPATARPSTASAAAATAGADATATAETQQAAGVADGAGDGRLVLPRPLPERTVQVPILMYHRIAPQRADATAYERELTVTPTAFEAQMRWLAESGRTPISQRQLYDALIEGSTLPARPVLITFDDGYREIAETAAPIMARHGMTGTAYVITDRIAADPAAAPQWLSEDQLRELRAAGWDIGSHTVSHRELPGLDEADALRQLRQSRYRLERILGEPVQWFCYPVGRYDDRSEELVRRAGYVLAVTTEQGTTQSARRPLLLERVRVANATGVAGLRAALGA